MVQQRHTDETDRTGFDETTNYLTRTLAKVVPTGLARRAVVVSVDTDRETYAVGDPVEITVTFRNRLPVPVEVPTPTNRRWGWEVDGVLEATDERRYVSASPLTFPFRAGERKTATAVWNGTIRRSDGSGLDRDEPVAPGEHTVSAFLSVDGGRARIEDSTTVRIE